MIKFFAITQTPNTADPSSYVIVLSYNVLFMFFFLIRFDTMAEHPELCTGPEVSQSSCSISESTPQCNGRPEKRTLLRVSESHGLQLLGVLRSFREQGLLFDFTIKVQDHSFPCHRCVLAAFSDFFRYLPVMFLHLVLHLHGIMWKFCVFRAMFEVDMRERGDGSVTLGNQCSAAVSCFLDFAYSGEALITDGNIDMLFQIASFLQVNYKYDVYLFFCFSL